MENGEHPPESLSRVDLGSFPWFTATLSSPLSPVEIRNLVAERITDRAGRDGGLAFTGSTWLGGFKVRVRERDGNREGPVLVGTVEETPSGSHLSIRLRLPHFASVWFVCWTLLLGVVAISLFVQSPLLSILVLGLGLLLPWARIWRKFKREGPQLLKLVEEECSVTLLPSPDRPTAF